MIQLLLPLVHLCQKRAFACPPVPSPQAARSIPVDTLACRSLHQPTPVRTPHSLIPSLAHSLPLSLPRRAGVGGLSGLMGWTEAQREASRTEGFGGGALNLIKFAAVILVLDLIWFGYEVHLLSMLSMFCTMGMLCALGMLGMLHGACCTGLVAGHAAGHVAALGRACSRAAAARCQQAKYCPAAPAAPAAPCCALLAQVATDSEVLTNLFK